MKKRPVGTEVLLESVARGIYNKQGKDVLSIDMRKLENRIADFFVICHGSSVTGVNSICDSVEEVVRKEAGEKALHVEGLENCFWVLMDYGDVIVHIFLEEYRNFYSLESLWADALIEVMDEKVSK